MAPTTITDIALLTYPIILGLASAALFVPKSKGKKQCGSVPTIRPPPWVFFTVWPILYVLIGVAGCLYYRRYGFTGTLAFFIAATLFLIGWWIVFNKICAPKVAFACLVAIAGMFVANACLFGHTMASWLIVPLIGWLCFACFLVYTTIRV
jgi:tryptophan-rich sensory protein